MYKTDRKIDFEMSLIVVEAIRGRRASFIILTATISGIFWWTDKLIYFSSIDGFLPYYMVSVVLEKVNIIPVANVGLCGTLRAISGTCTRNHKINVAII